VVLSGLFFALVGFLMNNVGADFYGSLFYLYYNGNPLISQMMITPSYVGLAMIASQNIVLDSLLAVGSALNVFNLMILMFIVGSRVMFAQALDRILPQKLADLGRRFVTPVNAMVVYFVGSVAWMIPASIYPTLYYYFTAVVLGVLLAYVLVGFAALVFPYKGKAVYETMPFSKYKIGGLHLISFIGLLNLIFCVFLVYFYSTIPALGLNNTFSLELVLAVYLILGVYYYANRWYKKQSLGYDVELAFKEVPPE